MHGLIAQMFKFGIVGVIAFVIDFITMVALTELFSVNPVLSSTISFIVSLVFNYLASMKYVFSHREGMSKAKEFCIFLVLSLIGLAINAVLMFLGSEYMAIDYRLVKLFATFVVMVWNFISRKAIFEGKAGVKS